MIRLHLQRERNGSPIEASLRGHGLSYRIWSTGGLARRPTPGEDPANSTSCSFGKGVEVEFRNKEIMKSRLKRVDFRKAQEG